MSAHLVVLSGPSGVGKSSVIREALKELPTTWLSVSATTRAPRPGEVHGENYFYVSQEEFTDMIANNELLEWAEFAGNRYGTPSVPVEEALLAGRNVLLEIEIDGARQVKAHMSNAITVFLEPPTWEELVARLVGRGTDSPERRAERLQLAQDELASAPNFDVVVVNDQVERVVEQLIALTS